MNLRKDLLINKNTFVFLYLGRINQEKGIIELIKAYKKICKEEDVLLIFVGSIEDNKLKNILKNERKIIYSNFTHRPEEWFLISDMLCLPSHREGFGTVVIEAGSCNLPALCSNVYGLNDAIIDNKTGFFHKVGDIDDIKKNMLYAVKNKKLLKKYGKVARKRVIKDFEQNILTKKLFKFITLNLDKK